MQKVKPVPITNFTTNKFDYVLQLADIHIKPLERHTEYRDIFEKLYAEIRKLQEAKAKVLIVICGDTLDHKSKLTVESYQLCAELFTNLSNLYPTLVILGNHDYQSTNKLHNLEPIVYPRKNFLFVPNTGVYDCDNLTICVNSIYDPETPFIKREQIDTNKFCMCMFHGTIVNSKNSDGYTFTNNNSNGRLCKTSDFQDYNLTTLGDIHLQQEVSKNIWYSGSLVQQNHGEPHLGHGYLLHKLKDKTNVTTQFVELVNNCGFVTITVDNNKWTNPNIQLPIKSSIRLIISNTIESKKQEIIDLIKSKTEILDLYAISNDKIIPNFKAITAKTKTIKSTDIILDEMKKLDYPQAKKNKLIDLHKNYMKKINLQNNTQGMYLWYPITLEFKNLFGYAGDHLNTIEFKTGVTSITASNASGKTSILNIIFYSLFNDLLLNPGRTKNADIINNKEKQGYVRLSIQYGTTVYTIEKEIKRQKNNQIEIQHKLTYIEDDKQIIKEQKLATDKLKDLFGTIADFYRCNILNNRDQSNDFFRMTDGEKIRYLKQSFNLDHFDDLLSFNKDSIKQTKIILAEKETKYKLLNDDSTLLTENDDDYEQKFNDKLNELITEQTTIDNELTQLNEQYNTTYKAITLKEKEIVPQIHNETKLKEELKTIKQQYHDFSPVYDLDQLRYDIKNQHNKLNKSIDLSRDDLAEKLINVTTDLNKLKKIKPWSQDKNTLYKTMIQTETNTNQLNKEIISLTDKIKKCNVPNKKQKVTKSITEINNEIDNLQKTYKDDPDISEQELEEKINQIEKNITDINISPDELIIKKSNLTNELNIIKRQIKKPISLINCDINYDELQNHIKGLKDKIQIIRPIETKHIINQTLYKKNLKELETIELNINQILQKTITNDNLTTYIEQLDTLLTKDKLMIKEYQTVKVNLFTPLKDLLTEIKTDTFNMDREKLKDLSNRKNILVKDINATKQQIEFNNKITNLIKENDTIKEQNQKIQNQIDNYEFHYHTITIQNIESQLNEINQLIEFNQYKFLLNNLHHNTELNKQIQSLKQMKELIEYNELQTGLTTKQKEYEIINKQYQQISQQYQLLTLTEEKDKYQQQLKYIEDNEIITKHIRELNNNINYEIQRRMYQTIQNNLDTIKNNIKLNNEIKKLTSQFEDIKTKQNHNQKSKLEIMIKIDTLQKTIDKIQKNNKETTTLHKEIETKQKELQLLELYGNLVSPKGLQTTIIKRELKKLETSMNEILSKYTKYSVDINYDTDKSNIEILTKIDTGEKLSIERLSTYETIILTTAFKRSMGKHINRTRSMLYIIDECMENMDQNNFEKVLPELMKMIVEEYSHVLIISQRDIQHIADQEIKIGKENNVSRILQ